MERKEHGTRGGEAWREGQVPAEGEARGPQRHRRKNLLGGTDGLDVGLGRRPPGPRLAGATLRAKSSRKERENGGYGGLFTAAF